MSRFSKEADEHSQEKLEKSVSDTITTSKSKTIFLKDIIYT